MRTWTQKQKLCLLVLLNTSVIAVSVAYDSLFRYAAARDLAWFSCKVRDTLGIYCPSCGGSRSVHALLSFDLWGSFVYFPPIPLTAGLLLALDVRLALDVLTHSDRFTSGYRGRAWLSVPICIIVVFLLRLLLWGTFGIDVLGDLS